MIRWIADQLRRRRIFRYWDGRRFLGFKRYRSADPILVWRTILADPDFDIEEDVQAMESPNREVASPSWVRCVNATRQALGVSALDGGGLTEEETVELFQGYCLYVVGLKKNSSILPISPGSTAEPSAPKSKPPDMRESAGSSSIPDVLNYAALEA